MNRSQAKIRALVEPAIATPKTWRLLRKLRCSTTRITGLVQAVLTLHLTCSNRGWKRLSHVGGPVLWPDSDMWPVRHEPHQREAEGCAPDEIRIARTAGESPRSRPCARASHPRRKDRCPSWVSPTPGLDGADGHLLRVLRDPDATAADRRGRRDGLTCWDVSVDSAVCQERRGGRAGPEADATRGHGPARAETAHPVRPSCSRELPENQHPLRSSPPRFEEIHGRHRQLTGRPCSRTAG